MGGADYVVHAGAKLPLEIRRFCGPEFRDNEHYLRTAEAEAERIVKRCALPHGGTVLDVGCGQGRLAIGLLRTAPRGSISYLGVDVDRSSVSWCAKHLANKSFRFAHVDVENARYNPTGQLQLEVSPFRFDVPDRSVDLIYAYSVFSHMELKQIEVYLAEFKRVLKQSGTIFLTTFIEDGLDQPFEVNPRGYAVPISGPLHVVRFDRRFWAKTVANAGLRIRELEHGVEANGQSGNYLSHA
ncbi:hypothetical protein KFE25_006881 [Diacronema lutheri]|uniref:Methyltransferase type 11 domain-containing protein n=1 Tax=Diacronema lutheri TaxID=2081491 RepID=A0A8J6CCR2_DIALT|nr:hypothetical protein KFE25_006881 [Diacronema lutheri]